MLDAEGNIYGTTYSGGEYNEGVVFQVKPNPDGTWTESVLHSFTFGADGGEPSGGLIFDAASNLYGTTQYGGAYGEGVAFRLKPNPDGTWTEKVLHAFTCADGAVPDAGLIFDAAGSLYGTTYFGGTYGWGVVFKLAPTSSGWSERVLHSFLGYGRRPSGPVIFDRAGNLYGTTSEGSTNYGLVFEITP